MRWDDEVVLKLITSILNGFTEIIRPSHFKIVGEKILY